MDRKKLIALITLCFSALSFADLTYPIVDTAQDACYDNSNEITPPAAGESFHGQDAQYAGNHPSYTRIAGGLTVHDNVTGLTWTQSPDLNGDGNIDASDKLTFAQAQSYPDTLNAANFGGFNDWRLPTIKELYSLMDFRGKDPSGYNGTDASVLTPYIDIGYFDFGYGDTTADERIIDAQFATSTLYVSTVMAGSEAMFGLNLADGRIKGYPTADKNYYVYFVRGNTTYGINDFVDNNDETITDLATGLMWQQQDSAVDMNSQDALDYAENLDQADYTDWRLPNAKELHSILDYSRSPATTNSPAINALFFSTAITDEGGNANFPFYWTSTTHVKYNGLGDSAVYIAFGEALGWMERPPGSGNYRLEDVHGAGAQRSDPKTGDPADYPYGHGPQGDVIRIYNYVRCVRDLTCGESGYPSVLEGDLNADCYVNLLDLAEIAKEWQSEYDLSDLAIFAQNWLNCIDPDNPCNYLEQ